MSNHDTCNRHANVMTAIGFVTGLIVANYDLPVTLSDALMDFPDFFAEHSEYPLDSAWNSWCVMQTMGNDKPELACEADSSDGN